MGDDTTFHYYTGAEQFVFRALFFEAENLAESVSHTVSWVINKSALNGTTGLFDYAVITVQESTTSTAYVRLYLHFGSALSFLEDDEQ